MMFGPLGRVVTSTALPGRTPCRILLPPSRKYTSSLLALTGGGANTPSCWEEQNCVDAVATGTSAATVACGLISIKVAADRTRPYTPLSGPALGDALGELEAAAVGEGLGECDALGDDPPHESSRKAVVTRGGRRRSEPHC